MHGAGNYVHHNPCRHDNELQLFSVAVCIENILIDMFVHQKIAKKTKNGMNSKIFPKKVTPLKRTVRLLRTKTQV